MIQVSKKPVRKFTSIFFLLFCFISALTALPAIAAVGDITTFAGGGTVDGGAATSANIRPAGVFVDTSGNIYIADSYNNLIRKVDTSGYITTVAGNGIAGYSGDGGPATSASLNQPTGVFVSSGIIYIADSYNNRIRMVDTMGIITTVAGNDISDYGGDGGPAISASLDRPTGVFVDTTGNIYVADSYNDRIRKVDTSGVITTIIGNGNFGYSGDGSAATFASLALPMGVFVDGSGNIYVADSYNNRIRKVDISGVITTIAGDGTAGYSGDGGPATSASLNQPSGVFVDSSGNIFIADSSNQRIRKVDTSGNITTIAGNGIAGYSGDGGPASSASLSQPTGAFVDTSGNIYIADTYNNRIREVTSGNITTIAGNGTFGYSGENVLPTFASLYQPTGVFVDSSGVYIADYGNQRIRKVDISGYITTVAGNGTAGYSGDGGPAIDAMLDYPTAVFVSSGNIYLADSINNRIRMVDTSSENIITVAGNGDFGYSGDGGPATSASLSQPTGIFVDSSGNIYIADSVNNCIRKVDAATGNITTVAGQGPPELPGYSGDNGPAISATLDYPTGVFVDSTGNIYIADRYNHVIRKVDTSPDHIITTVAGNGTEGYSGDGGPATSAMLDQPSGVFVDIAGSIYIADLYNHCIRKVDISGLITTVAGNGAPGYSGDGGPAASASLFYPFGVFMNTSTGDIYIADTVNNRLRKVEGPGDSLLPAVKLTNEINFGPTQVGSASSPKAATIRNTGDNDLIINSFAITGANASEFIQTSNCFAIPSKGSCAITVVFKPALPYGKKIAAMSFSSNDPKKPVVHVKLSGQAPPPKIFLSSKSVRFGSVQTGSAVAHKVITIKNTGISDLLINSITITGMNANEFDQTNGCTTIAKGSSCDIAVSFNPLSAGAKQAIMSISSNDVKKPVVTVKLRGKGK